MVRIAISFAGGLFLIFIESLIASKLTGSGPIVFDGIPSFITIWAMNFFLLFTMMTHLKFWLANRVKEDENLTTF